MPQPKITPVTDLAPDVNHADLIPPWAFVVIGVVSAEIGAAYAKQLFEAIGTSGVVFVRTLVAAALFILLWRPKWRGYTRSEYLYISVYGTMIATMMLAFYVAISRVPLGVAVATSFIGPLGVATLSSRRAIDFLWVLAASAGIVILSPFTNSAIDPVGILFALLSGLAWAIYTVLSGRVARIFQNNAGLAISMSIAALVAFPFGVNGVTKIFSAPQLLLQAVFVALLSSALPFAVQYQALKKLPPRVYGILASLEPVAAALIGFLLLHEPLGVREIIGITLVTMAAVATTQSR